jgi:hypothetical protein
VEQWLQQQQGGVVVVKVVGTQTWFGRWWGEAILFVSKGGGKTTAIWVLTALEWVLTG